MPEPKTKVNDASVSAFLDAIPDERLREDCHTIAAIMESIVKAKPKMWGTGIVGFGEHRSLYANGKYSDWMLTAFAPRKGHLTLYLMGGEKDPATLQKLGKFKLSGGCLHIKHLSDIDLSLLTKMIRTGVKEKQKTNLLGKAPKQKSSLKAP